MKREPLSPSQRDGVETILELGKTLMALLNDVLDLSKIEAGKLNIEQTDGNLRNNFLHLQKLFSGRAEEKSYRACMFKSMTTVPDDREIRSYPREPVRIQYHFECDQVHQ